MKHISVCITGGHLVPALAVIEEIRVLHPEWDILFIGRKYSLEGDKVLSEEARIITSKGIRFLPLITGRFRRSIDITSVLSLIKVPFGFIQSLYYCIKFRPTIILSFGGYVALPVVITAWLMGIPAVTHEQTKNLGLANTIISLFAKKICLSHSIHTSSASNKVVYTGLPIRPSIFQHINENKLGIRSTYPIIYIMGGTTGALTVNNLIYPILSKLLINYQVIHQVGRKWIQNAKQVRRSIRGDKRPRYYPYPYLDTSDHAWVLQHAKLVIARSGANTVGEISALGKVALLLPLPWSGKNEQYINALSIASEEAGVILDQQKITPEAILESIDSVIHRYSDYQKKAEQLSHTVVRDGARKIIQQLEQTINV